MRLPLMAFARAHGGEVGSRVLARRLGALDLGKGLRVPVVAEVQLGQHARVQHTHDEDRFLINLPEIEHVLPLYPPPVPGRTSSQVRPRRGSSASHSPQASSCSR